MAKRLTKKEFIERAMCILGDNYDFTKTTYINAHVKTIITCKIHGDFLVEPCNVLNHNCGCPYCSGEKISRSKTCTTQKFVEKAKKMHGDKYNYSLVHYERSSEKVPIICPIHGIFYQTPNNHLKGCGCPLCSTKKQPE